MGGHLVLGGKFDFRLYAGYECLRVKDDGMGWDMVEASNFSSDNRNGRTATADIAAETGERAGYLVT